MVWIFLRTFAEAISCVVDALSMLIGVVAAILRYRSKFRTPEGVAMQLSHTSSNYVHGSHDVPWLISESLSTAN